MQAAQALGKFGPHGGQVVLGYRAALRSEVVAVALHLEESDMPGASRRRPVQYQDGCLDARIRLKYAGRQRHYGDQIVLDQHLSQLRMRALALEYDALRHDDGGATARRQMLRYVIHEQHLAAARLHTEAAVRAYAALRRHEGRVGEYHIGVVVPALFAGQRVVLVDAWLREAVQVHVHQREAHHVGGNVVAGEVVDEARMLVGRERGASVVIARRVPDVLVRGYEEAGRAACGIEHALVLLRVDYAHHEVDDVARRAELPGVALRIHHRKQMLEGVAQPLGVVVFEVVYDIEEHPQRFGVPIWQIDVVEDVAEQRRDVRVFGYARQCFGVEVEHFMPAESGVNEVRPAILGELAGEECALAAQFLALGVDVVHELVDERDGNLLDLTLGVRYLAHENVARFVYSALGVYVEHLVVLYAANWLNET